ncbi:hypothetical protein ACFLY2_02470 [Patescibacteria group bacterium]
MVLKGKKGIVRKYSSSKILNRVCMDEDIEKKGKVFLTKGSKNVSEYDFSEECEIVIKSYNPQDEDIYFVRNYEILPNVYNIDIDYNKKGTYYYYVMSVNNSFETFKIESNYLITQTCNQDYIDLLRVESNLEGEFYFQLTEDDDLNLDLSYKITKGEELSIEKMN